MTRYDLHCHSTCSDGLLSPRDVVRRAAARGVDVVALTDHDEVAGIAEAGAAAEEAGIGFVAGCELSVTWRETTIHVIALGIDERNPTLLRGLDEVRRGRNERARRIGRALADAGIPGAFEGALRYVTSERLVSRTHFARHLVDAGHARDLQDVFARFLTRGKPGHVEHRWPGLATAVRWIHGASGQAVLAHPGRYALDRVAREALFAEFRDEGGDALEVISAAHDAGRRREFASVARRFGFAASCGSDFHGDAGMRPDLGDIAALPAGLTPVWASW